MICIVAMVSDLLAADPLEQFLDAMGRRDETSMRTVVRKHQQYMTTTFFAILAESTRLIHSAQRKDVLRKPQVLLVVASTIARVMDSEFRGNDLLYSQFEGAQEALTPEVRASIGSDYELRLFLLRCALRLEITDNRDSIATNLSSILTAYGEHRQSISFPEMVSALQQAKNLSALLELLHTPSLGVERRRIVIGALGSLRDQAVLDGLLTYLPDPELADAVVRALGEIGGGRASAILTGKLDDIRIGEQAEQALVKIGILASPALLEKFRSQGWSSGIKRAGRALIRIGFEPESIIDEARLMLAQEKTLDLIGLGPAVLPVLIPVVTAEDLETRTTAIVVIATYLVPVSITALVLVFVIVDPWVRPSLKVTLAHGTCTQQSYGRTVPGVRSQEPGSILETRWARDWLGRRHRIKVETLVSGLHTDAIVSVGQSVKTGLYLARGRNKSVRIRVK